MKSKQKKVNMGSSIDNVEEAFRRYKEKSLMEQKKQAITLAEVLRMYERNKTMKVKKRKAPWEKKLD